MVIPGYKVEIWYQVSRLPNAFVFIYCTRAGSSRAQRVERRLTGDTTKGHFGIIPTN